MTDTKRKYLILHQNENKIHFWRLSEDEFRQLRCNSVPTKTDGMFLLQIMLAERHNPNRLTLPKAFLILERLFDKSSTWFDDWKGSFSFPLLVKIQKPDSAFLYLLRIEDFRGSIEYRLYRVLEDGPNGMDIYAFKSPVESEFSNQEINEFIHLVHEFLTDATYFFVKQEFQPFFKRIDSNNILYGYQDSAFFEEQIDSEEEFQAKVNALEERFGSTKQIAQKQEVQLLLQSIIGEEHSRVGS